MEFIDQNGPNFHYLLQYKKRGWSTWKNKTFNAATHQFQIPNAGYYELWDFRIWGVNDAGPEVCVLARLILAKTVGFPVLF